MQLSLTNKILFGLLFVQLLAVALTMGGKKEPLGLEAAVEVFPDLDPEKVGKVVIYGPSADGESQEQVSLSRQGDGWVIADADDFPAKGEEVKDLLDTLGAMESRQVVLRSDTYHEKLEVSDEAYRRKLSLTVDGKPKTIYVGSSPRYNNVHIRSGESDLVYQVNGFTESNAGARAWSWVDRKYVSVPKDNVWRVQLENANGKFALSRDVNANTWMVEGSTLTAKASEIESLLSDLRDIGLETPVGKAEDASQGLDQVEDGAHIVLTTGTSTAAGLPPETTEEIVIRVGKPVKDKGRRFVKASSSDYVVQVADYELNKILETKVLDLQEAPQEPEPAKVEPAKVEPAKVEAKPEPAKPEPAKVEPAKVEPAKVEAKAEPAKVEPKQALNQEKPKEKAPKAQAQEMEPAAKAEPVQPKPTQQIPEPNPQSQKTQPAVPETKPEQVAPSVKTAAPPSAPESKAPPQSAE